MEHDGGWVVCCVHFPLFDDLERDKASRVICSSFLCTSFFPFSVIRLPAFEKYPQRCESTVHLNSPFFVGAKLMK